MRVRVSSLVLLFAVFLVTGCKSTYLISGRHHPFRFDGGPELVYVTNPEMQLEYDLLKASGIYQLTNEPAGRRLTLRKLEEFSSGCGNPLIFSGLTLGIVPGFLPAAVLFSYDLETNGRTETRYHELPLFLRASVWEWLVGQSEKEKEGLMAQALGTSPMYNSSLHFERDSRERNLESRHIE